MVIALNPDQTLRAVHRSNQAYFEQVAEREFLDFGVALYNTDYPWLAEANQVIDVRFEEGASESDLQAAVGQVEEFYAGKGLRCGAWRPAPAQDATVLGAVLVARGYAAGVHQCMALGQWPDLRPPEGVEIQSARAFRDPYRALHREMCAGLGETIAQQSAEIAVDRLSDQRLDGFVAMVERRPAGCAAFLTVGDIGRIVDLYVTPGLADQPIGIGLIQHILEACRPVGLRCICAEAGPAARRLIDLYKVCGFAAGSSYTSFQAVG